MALCFRCLLIALESSPLAIAADKEVRHGNPRFQSTVSLSGSR